MKLLLTYFWEQAGRYPSTTYEFEVEVKKEDVVAYIMKDTYLMPQEKKGFKKGLEFMYDYFKERLADILDDIDYATDSEFVEFMKERYEEQAVEEWYESL